MNSHTATRAHIAALVAAERAIAEEIADNNDESSVCHACGLERYADWEGHNRVVGLRATLDRLVRTRERLEVRLTTKESSR